MSVSSPIYSAKTDQSLAKENSLSLYNNCNNLIAPNQAGMNQHYDAMQKQSELYDERHFILVCRPRNSEKVYRQAKICILKS